MKRKTTKEILADSFRELAEARPVDKITIQEIVDNCEYSSATFYRHFKDKYDLIVWDYVHRTTVIMDKIGKDEYEWKDTLWDAMAFYHKNKEYIQNLIKPDLHAVYCHDGFLGARRDDGKGTGRACKTGLRNLGAAAETVGKTGTGQTDTPGNK